jgi:hypothetical protein
MNNEQQQIIDEVYENYNSIFTKKYNGENLKLNQYPLSEDVIHRLILSQEEFINKCKTDPEFSERWGLKIEERELSLEERRKLANYDSVFVSPMTVESWDRNNIPTKLITTTKITKIESYE